MKRTLPLAIVLLALAPTTFGAQPASDPCAPALAGVVAGIETGRLATLEAALVAMGDALRPCAAPLPAPSVSVASAGPLGTGFCNGSAAGASTQSIKLLLNGEEKYSLGIEPAQASVHVAGGDLEVPGFNSLGPLTGLWVFPELGDKGTYIFVSLVPVLAEPGTLSYGCTTGGEDDVTVPCAGRGSAVLAYDVGGTILGLEVSNSGFDNCETMQKAQDETKTLLDHVNQ